MVSLLSKFQSTFSLGVDWNGIAGTTTSHIAIAATGIILAAPEGVQLATAQLKLKPDWFACQSRQIRTILPGNRLQCAIRRERNTILIANELSFSFDSLI